jgi:small subunit ribosomal protein S4
VARYTDAKCKLCRREGAKLFLKGERCYTAKCAIERRPFAPGMHGKTPKKFSDYGVRLRNKQMAKRFYGPGEKSFYNIYVSAVKKTGVTGTVFLQLLESRLDNVVYRSGLADSRAEARQLVRHGHFSLNGHPVDVPSMRLKKDDTVKIKYESKKTAIQLEKAKDRKAPNWLEVDLAKKEIRFLSVPERKEIDAPFEEQYIVEYYSK